jgi:hypothetical protein
MVYWRESCGRGSVVDVLVVRDSEQESPTVVLLEEWPIAIERVPAVGRSDVCTEWGREMKDKSSGKDFSWAEMLEIRVVPLTEICNCSGPEDTHG